MNTLTRTARLCSFLLAVLTSAAVLGGTLALMAGDDDRAQATTIAMQTLGVRTTAVN